MGVTQKAFVRFAYSLLFFLTFAVSATLTVRFLVRSGEDVVVPAVEGKSAQEAQYLLLTRQLSMNVQGTLFSEGLPQGTVLQQSIAPGERVRKGRSVHVYVSKGPRQRVVPRVIGLERAAAISLLETSNFEFVEAAKSCSDSLAAGLVAAQEPIPGSSMLAGKVKLLFSTGSCANRFVMPDLIGRSYEPLHEKLGQNGFSLVSMISEEKEGALPGIILEQEPVAGSIVTPFDPISFFVAMPVATAATRPPESRPGRLVYFTIPVPPSLLRKEMTLRLDREGMAGSYAIDFLPTPGKNQTFTFWMPEGSQLVLLKDGVEVLRRIY